MTSRTKCKICNHPGIQEINQMILNGVEYGTIAKRMKQIHPLAPGLITPNFTNHKKNHLLNQPITVVSEDGEKTTFITGAAVQNRIQVHKEALPELSISLPQALGAIIELGVSNLLAHPELVTPDVLMKALTLFKQLGHTGDDAFSTAWSEFLNQGKRKRRTRKVTVEESQEFEDDATVVEGSVVPQLPAPQQEEAAWGWDEEG